MILYMCIIPSGTAVRGWGGVAGEGKLVDVPTFHSWGKCTMTLTNIQSDWMSNTSSGLCIILNYVDPLFRILGCNDIGIPSFIWVVTS